jgi:hypothetical protein
MVSGVVEAVERFAPDVLVDLEAFAGALVAQRLGLPWATSATNTAVLTDPFSGTPKIEAWLQKLMTDLRHHFGVPEEARDLWFSPSLVLAFTTAALLGSTAHLGGQVRLVGPSITPRPSSGDQCAQTLAADPDRQAVIVDPAGVLSAVAEHVLVQRTVPSCGCSRTSTP